MRAQYALISFLKNSLENVKKKFSDFQIDNLRIVMYCCINDVVQ